MTKRNRMNRMMSEALLLSLFSVGLQGLGLLFNVFLTRRLGAANVGAITLTGSFYSLAAVISGGSGFLAASRFISEEIGCSGNPKRVFRYVLRFCIILSIAVSGMIFLLAPLIVQRFLPDACGIATVRMLCLSLPVAAVLACLKGRCYAYQRVIPPAIAEYIEFVVKSGTLAFCAVFLLPQNKMTIFGAFAISMLAGQGSAVLFLAAIRIPHICEQPTCSCTFRRLLILILPMIGNACLVAILSSTNDALVPLTLLQYGSSTEEALSQFGEFEAIIIPTLFFPSVVQCCLSALLVPSLSRARTENRFDEIRMQTEKILEQTVSYALFIVLLIGQFGTQIGMLLGGNSFTGQILCKMAPVVPFIYLEIVLEGILRGLGKQNFSSLNYLAEYTVRISVLLICVPLFGFYGIVLSYMACNLTGNAVRLYFVLRVTELKPVWKRILGAPAVAFLCGMFVMHAVRQLVQGVTLLPVAAVTGGLAYWSVMYLLNRQPDSFTQKRITGNANCPNGRKIRSFD